MRVSIVGCAVRHRAPALFLDLAVSTAQAVVTKPVDGEMFTNNVWAVRK